MKINWSLFPSTLPKSLCVGEERQLTAEEIREANELIGSLFTDTVRLEEIFDRARGRFQEKS